MLPGVVGHARALATLPDPLPSVVLITGPEGVGKRLIAQHIAHRTGATGTDLQNLGFLNRAKADALIAHHETAPMTSPVKTSVANLTETSPAALNAILKLVEEPPPWSRLVLHTDRPPLLTLRSRCYVVSCGLLSQDEVHEVLTAKHAKHADEASKASYGRVSVGLEYSRNFPVRMSLDAILDALTKRSGQQLEDAMSAALTMPPKMERDEYAERLDALKAMLRRAVLTKQGVIAEVRPDKWAEAVQIMDRPGRNVLLIRSAVWTLVMGL